MTEILLIRHGETAWNAERRLQGHTDIGLNEAGEKQAAALGRALAQEALTAVLASDLGRASRTAQYVAAHHGMEVELDPGLRERCYGGFEGLRYKDIAERYPQEYAAWQARDIDALPPAGERQAETVRQFHARVLAALDRISVRHAGQRIAVVAHGGVLEVAYRAAMGLPLDTPREFPVLNASVNRLHRTPEGWRIAAWGNVAHLQAGALDEIA